MSGVQTLLERRILAALEASARVALPAPWDGLRPARSDSLRQAAAVLLRIAQHDSPAEMAAALRKVAEEVGARRGGREGGEQALWPRVASALEGVGTLRPETHGVLGLAIWGSRIPVAELGSSLRGLLPAQWEPGPAFLTALARTLLRALARSWTEAAHQKEKKERGG